MPRPALLLALLPFAACVETASIPVTMTTDTGEETIFLSPIDAAKAEMRKMKEEKGDEEAGIWLDPQGCYHYITDRGEQLGGFLYALFDANGAPICTIDKQ